MKNFEITDKNSQDRENIFGGDTWVLESKIELVEKIADELNRRFKNAGWSKDEIGAFIEAVGDAFNNAVLHGNLGIKRGENESMEEWEKRIKETENSELARNKKVFMKITIGPEEAKISIKDEGGGFSLAGIEDPLVARNLTKPSGRGIKIMEKECDSLTFDGSTVTMIRKRNRL